MNILSNWRLTWSPAASPVVLVAYGDEIERELDGSLAVALTQTPLVRSAQPRLRTGAVAVSFDITVFVDGATDKAAREAMMDSLVYWSVGRRAPLKIEVAGLTGKSWTFADAVVTAHVPRRVVEDDPGIGSRWARRYSIVATGISVTG